MNGPLSLRVLSEMLYQITILELMPKRNRTNGELSETYVQQSVAPNKRAHKYSYERETKDLRRKHIADAIIVKNALHGCAKSKTTFQLKSVAKMCYLSDI